VPKTLSVFRVAKHHDATGESLGPEEVALYIPVHHIKHRKVGAALSELAVTVHHEVTHSIRSEGFVGDSLVESAATEGLAYVGEDLLKGELLEQDETYFFRDAVQLFNDGEYAANKALMVKESDLSVPETPEAVEVYKEWFGLDNRTMPTGIVIGVTEVYRRLQEGNKFAELLAWPPERIIGLREASVF
jgi:hypothetical protein